MACNLKDTDADGTCIPNGTNSLQSLGKTSQNLDYIE